MRLAERARFDVLSGEAIEIAIVVRRIACEEVRGYEATMNDLEAEKIEESHGCDECPACFDAHQLHIPLTVDGRCRECGFTHPE